MRLSCIVVLSLAVTTPCLAQEATESVSSGDPRIDALKAARMAAEVHAMAAWLGGKAVEGKPDPTPALLEAYADVVKNSESVRRVLATEFGEYLANKHNTKSAPQASQIAQQTSLELQLVQAVQNQRIIELLTELVRQRDAGRSAPATPPAAAKRPSQ